MGMCGSNLHCRHAGYPINDCGGYNDDIYKADDIIGVFTLPSVVEAAKNFFGVWTPQTIGRINIYDDGIAQGRYEQLNAQFRKEVESVWDELKKKY
jgi:hypothetical protein